MIQITSTIKQFYYKVICKILGYHVPKLSKGNVHIFVYKFNRISEVCIEGSIGDKFEKMAIKE